MRIAFITPEFVTERYYSGGLANYLHRLSSAMADLGNEVHIIVQSDQPPETFRFGQVWVTRVLRTERSARIRKVARRFLIDAQRWVMFAFNAWRTLERLHRERPFDIVQVPNYCAAGLFVVAFSKIPHVTRLSSLQRPWHEAAQRKRHPGLVALEWLEGLQLYLSKDIYAPSATLASTLSRPKWRRPVEVIHSPIFVEVDALDPEVYRTHLAEKQYLLFVGRYEVYKGVEILAEALPGIFRELPDCEAVFVGMDVPRPNGSSMKAFVRKKCKASENRLHFFDQMPHAQLYPVMCGARLVVLPSLVDNLPNTLLEVLALGRPVLGTVGTSFDELIRDGENGFLVEAGNSEALSAKVLTAWNHPELGSIAQRGEEDVARLHPSIAVPALIDYYARLIGDQTCA